MKSIERQSGYKIRTSASIWMDEFTQVSVKVKNLPVKKAMEQALKGLPFKADVQPANGIIVITVDTLYGQVTGKDGMPLPGITVTVRGAGNNTVTDANGIYRLRNLAPGDTVMFTSVSTEEYTHKVPHTLHLDAILEEKVNALTEVVVNGFQHMKKNKMGGSVDWTGREVFNLPLWPDLNSNIEGRVTGLQILSNKTAGTNQPPGVIRGITTFATNPHIQYVLDNFPYDGDLSNINPNDIESITVLKDAAAASLWGVRAGNGVIVITTQRGKINQPLRMELNSRIALMSKSNLYKKRAFLDAPDFIGLERFFFTQGYYDPLLYDPSSPVLTPAVELLHKGNTQILTNADMEAQLDALAKNDVRADLRKYAWREAVSQEYAFNLSAGGSKSSSYLFAGFSRNPGNLVNNDYHRENISFRQTYQPSKKIRITADNMWMQHTVFDNNDGNLGAWYPYAQLADAQGKALAIPAERSISYIDTAGRGALPDWRLRPLDELRLANNKLLSYDLYFSLSLRYKPVHGLTAAAYLKYAWGGTHRENIYDAKTFYVRNMVNSYTPAVIPLGDIEDQVRYEYKSHNARFQLDYEYKPGENHSITIMAGAEQPTITTNTRAGREYGIVNGQAARIDYRMSYPMYYSPMQFYTVEDKSLRANTTGNTISGYANITWSYLDRCIVSVNARKDASNLFGVNASNRSVPLGAASALLNLLKMPFFKTNTFSECNIRLSAGYNGNFDSSATQFASAVPGGVNSYGLSTLTLVTMSNPGLTWEKVRILNVGMDIAAWKNAIACNADIYVKEGIDLIADGRQDPTTGLTSQRRNTAGIISKGIDVHLRTRAGIAKKTSWTTDLIFNYTNSTINHYPGERLPAWQYVIPVLDKPVEGTARNGLFSFKSRGLDPKTGDPQGEWRGSPCKNYLAMIDTTDRASLVYSGPSIPVIFGSFRNVFTWKQVQLLVDISYKLNYYFRRSSIDYTAVWNHTSLGHIDYKNRWKAPGDETRTSIPSRPQQFDPLRDLFYTYSDVLITKGDHIRLQDIRLSYQFNRNSYTSLPFREMYVYASAHNLGILWRANKYGIDPDFPESYPAPLMIAMGAKVIF